MRQLQRERRTNPYAWTWEIPAGLALAVLTVAAAGVHLARSLAVLVAGGGWVAAPRHHLVTSLPGILRGDATAGLTSTLPVEVHPGLLAGCLLLVETGVAVLTVVALREGWDRWGPGRLRGMATRAEAEAVLGLTRLRRAAPIVRPDAYAHPRRRGRRGRSAHSEAGPAAAPAAVAGREVDR